MIEQLILGIIQGIVEWLPVSSEGTLLLANQHFLKEPLAFEMAIRQALFLHFGTFLAALIYFHKDVLKLSKACFHFKKASQENQKIIQFLILATIISGILGLSLIKLVNHMAHQFDPTGKPITLIIGIFLLGTGLLELKAKHSGYRSAKDITLFDCILLGIVQGFAALPGFSRSGLTVSALLLRKYDKAITLKLSFLMSMPIVLGGNLILHLGNWNLTAANFVGLGASFIFGLGTIHLLLKLAEKVNFGLFVLLFGLLTILTASI